MLKAQITYDKAGPALAKNKLLGFGLMKMHEWLFEIGEGKKLASELHNWLAVYKGVSKNL